MNTAGISWARSSTSPVGSRNGDGGSYKGLFSVQPSGTSRQGYRQKRERSLVPLELAGILQSVLTHPSTRFLRRLDISPAGRGEDLTPVIHQLARGEGRPPLRALILGDNGEPAPAIDRIRGNRRSGFRFGNVTHALERYFDLHELTLSGQVRVDAIELPRLRKLSFAYGEDHPDGLGEIMRANLPRLKELVLAFPRFHGLPRRLPSVLAEVFKSDAYARLQRLTLHNVPESALAILGSSPLPENLEDLKLHIYDRAIDEEVRLDRLDPPPRQDDPTRLIMDQLIGRFRHHPRLRRVAIPEHCFADDLVETLCSLRIQVDISPNP